MDRVMFSSFRAERRFWLIVEALTGFSLTALIIDTLARAAGF